MPSKSPAQKRLMAAVAHGWHKPGGGGPSVKVAKEFNQADAKHHNPGPDREQMARSYGHEGMAARADAHAKSMGIAPPAKGWPNSSKRPKD